MRTIIIAAIVTLLNFNTACVAQSDLILDNLAEGKAASMFIAIPNNQVIHRNHPEHADLTFDIFEKELRNHVIPVIDQNYSTIQSPKGRAISGLSMGGRHSMFIGFRSLDLFAKSAETAVMTGPPGTISYTIGSSPTFGRILTTNQKH